MLELELEARLRMDSMCEKHVGLGAAVEQQRPSRRLPYTPSRYSILSPVKPTRLGLVTHAHHDWHSYGVKLTLRVGRYGAWAASYINALGVDCVFNCSESAWAKSGKRQS